jgi:hypothetical protein
MTFDDHEIDTLMTWARQHAPILPWDDRWEDERKSKHRRVLLEIAAEEHDCLPSCHNPCLVNGEHDRVIARAYLAEPRCHPWHMYVGPCECSPLAETRLG